MDVVRHYVIPLVVLSIGFGGPLAFFLWIVWRTERAGRQR